MANLTGFGKLHSYQDPKLEREFANLYRKLQSLKISGEDIKRDSVADAVKDRLDSTLGISARLDLVHVVSGTPEGVLPANVGHIALRTDGGVGATLYVKETGSGNTGWVAK